MEHFDVPQFLAILAVILGGAKLAGALAQAIGQPAVLGELVAGVLLGKSMLGIVDSHNETLHLLAELGVVILLFEIGIETDLGKLFKVGGESAATAIVGVVLPFALGYALCRMLGLENLVGIVVGASLTATSVGITARVLSDLNRMKEPESQIILGAAVIDDVIGLVILAIVANMADGGSVTPWSVLQITGVAFGFLAGTLLIGSWIVPPIAKVLSKIDLPGTPTMLAIILAFGLAWLASVAGSAMIIGAFAAGLLLRGTPHAHEIEKGVASLGHFFVPLFFVAVGASVDIQVFNPMNSENYMTVMIGGCLVVIAIVGKYLAGFAPFWYRGNKQVIGVGMIPRGEVGLIFAQMGLSTGVFDMGIFGAVTLMVMVTTFVAPPWLKWLFPKQAIPETGRPSVGIDELVNEP